MPWHALPPSEALARLGSSASGLDTPEAAAGIALLTGDPLDAAVSYP